MSGALAMLVPPDGRVRHATAAFDRHAPAVLAALRRALPFLARSGVEVAAEPARIESAAELVASHASPGLVVDLVTAPGGTRALLTADAAAIGIILEGMLGGGVDAIATAPVDRLTTARRALATRALDAVRVELSTSLAHGLGLTFDAVPRSADEPADGRPVAVTAVVHAFGLEGRITLALASEAVAARLTHPEPTATEGDARIANVLGEVELDLVIELGRLRVPLARLASLSVGDTLRLDVPVDGAVTVRVTGTPLFSAQPTTVGRQIAVRIVERHGA